MTSWESKGPTPHRASFSPHETAGPMKAQADLGGGFNFFLFSPLPGEDYLFDYIIFFKGVETTNQRWFITPDHNRPAISYGPPLALRVVSPLDSHEDYFRIGILGPNNSWDLGFSCFFCQKTFMKNSRCCESFHQLTTPKKPAIQLPKTLILSYVFQVHEKLSGDFKYVLFSPLTLGKWSNLTDIFQMGWFNHQPEKVKLRSCKTTLNLRFCCFTASGWCGQFFPTATLGRVFFVWSWYATWRIIPVSKWLITPIYKPFRPFARGTTLLMGLINHGY